MLYRGNTWVMVGVMAAVGVVMAVAVYWIAVRGGGSYRTEAPAADITPYPTPTPVMPTSEADKPEPTGVMEAKAVVVWEPAGAISQADRDQIQARVVDPFIDYYRDLGQGRLLTFTVSVNTQANAATYPYLAKGIFDNGVNNGFVVERAGGQIKWWYPECMGPCPLSAEFKAKYPEIAKILGQ